MHVGVWSHGGSVSIPALPPLPKISMSVPGVLTFAVAGDLRNQALRRFEHVDQMRGQVAQQAHPVSPTVIATIPLQNWAAAV